MRQLILGKRRLLIALQKIASSDYMVDSMLGHATNFLKPLKALYAIIMQMIVELSSENSLKHSNCRNACPSSSLTEDKNGVGGSRYKDAIHLYSQIREFIGKARKEEQPLQRVADFLHMQQDGSTLRVLQASALSLKCEIAIFTDFMTIRQPLISLRPDIKMDFTDQMNKSISVINMAQHTFPVSRLKATSTSPSSAPSLVPLPPNRQGT
ncbi:hypothetical protein HD806DRAFT_551673 [Xylariaceae sp. AK1471]|nr:hypothetical protein HD806DRAFT_551673 [Xylariaceae sp. AK1471]